MQKAFVTGGTGLIGLALLDELEARGVATTLLLRPASPRRALVEGRPGLTILEGDLHAESAGIACHKGDFDAFFHLGWNTATREVVADPSLQASEILQTLGAVELARRLDCRVFVGVGSQAEYGRAEGLLRGNTPTWPESAYGIAKLAAGRLSRIRCEDLDLRHCWCRVLSVYGPWDKATTGIMYCIDTLLRGEAPALTPCGQRWDFVYSRDCAAALVAIAESGRHGATYPIGSGAARPLREYFEELRDAIDPRLELGLGRKPYGDRQVMLLAADLSELTADTGFRPQVPFPEGIARTIAWRRAHPDGIVTTGSPGPSAH